MRLFFNDLFIINIILFLFLSGCSPSGEHPDSHDSGIAEDVHATHLKMVELLDSIGRAAKPSENYHLNSLKAQAIGAQAQGERDPGLRIQLIFQYALQMLNAGQADQAIQVLENLIQGLGGMKKALQPQTRTIVDILGVAWMRKGELENCVANHNAFTCILPLQPEARHQLTQGSEQAMRVFEQILEVYPEDLQTRYLFNLAAVTLGDYPSGVPAQWRMPLTPPLKEDFPRFPNRAVGLGLDIDGIAGGSCMDDFSGDDRLDLMVSSYMYGDQLRYFKQKEDGQLVEETTASGLAGITGGLNMKQADYNNDGHLDLLLLRGGWLGVGGCQPNSLLQNNGDGTFSDVTIPAGLLDFSPGQTAEWADYNGDGWLDLFVGYESGNFNDRQGEAGVYGDRSNTHPCRLFKNQGDGTFVDVAPELGLDLTGFVKGVAWADFNNDQWPDLYVSILGAPNRMYLNRSGRKPGERTFENVAAIAGVEEPLQSFPCWAGDINNDGFTDLFVAGYDLDRLFHVGEEYARELLGLPPSAEPPRLYLNKGDGTFSEVSEQMNLDKPLFAMGLNAGDIDNDGWLDLLVGTGAPDLRSIVPNRMFRNVGGERFEDLTSHGFGNIQKGHGISFGDMDADGDQDIYMVIGGAYQGDNAQNVLFENPGQKENRFVTLQLEGTTANRSAIGARVLLEVMQSDGTTRSISRTVGNGASFGANSLQLEIGLGKAEQIQNATIDWPIPGTKSVSTGPLPDNCTVSIREGSEKDFRVLSPAPVILSGSGHGVHHH